MKRSGFTLIEVLIASMIIFTTISLSVLAYQSSAKAIQSAENTALMLRPLPLILDNIEAQLRDVPKSVHESKGQVLGVNYSWKAEPLSSYSPPARFDPDKGAFVEYPERFVMYNVSLTLRMGLKEKKFNYRKLGWLVLASGNIEGGFIE